MKEAIKLLQKYLVESCNDMSLNQLQKFEKLIRDLRDLEYDVHKANSGISGKQEDSCPVCKVSGVSVQQKE